MSIQVCNSTNHNTYLKPKDLIEDLNELKCKKLQAIMGCASDSACIAFLVAFVATSIFAVIACIVASPMGVGTAVGVFCLSALVGAGVSIACGTCVAHVVLRILKAKHRTFEELKSKYEKNQKLQGKLLKKNIIDLMQVSNDEWKKKWILKMDFQQLAFAKGVVPEAGFKQYIESSSREPHRLWRFIFNLSKKQDYVAQLAKANALFARAALQQATKLNISSVMKTLQTINNSWDKKNLKKTPLIIGLNGEEVFVDKDLLCKKSGYFNRLVNSSYKEGNRIKQFNKCEIETGESHFLTSKEDIETFKFMLRIIEGKEMAILSNVEHAFSLVRIANFYEVNEIIKIVDDYLALHVNACELKTFVQICEDVPTLSESKISLENALIQRGPKTIGELVFWQGIAKKLNLNKLQANNKRIFQESIQDAVLQRPRYDDSGSDISNVLDEKEIAVFAKFAKRKLSLSTFQVIYGFAKQLKDTTLLQDCLDFCRAHVEEFKNTQWEVLENDQDIMKILYPSVV